MPERGEYFLNHTRILCSKMSETNIAKFDLRMMKMVEELGYVNQSYLARFTLGSSQE